MVRRGVARLERAIHESSLKCLYIIVVFIIFVHLSSLQNDFIPNQHIAGVATQTALAPACMHISADCAPIVLDAHHLRKNTWPGNEAMARF